VLDHPKSLLSWHEQFLEQRHFGSLDGVRFFCIMAVLWHHTNPPNSPQLLTRGFLGVDMFFVLSGFLIVTLLLREQSTKGKISLRKFYARRALRIFPVYYGILLVFALFYLIFRANEASSATFFSVLPFYLSFTSNWSLVQIPGLEISWSLATEEQFYLFWPAIEKLTHKRIVYVVLGVIILINQLMNFGILDDLFIFLYKSPEATKLLDTTFTPICLGIGLAHLLHRFRYFTWVFHSLGNRYAPIIILPVLLGLISFSPIDISGFPRLLIQLIMTLWLGSLVVREDHILQPVLIATPIARIGKISYGMYMYHILAFVIAASATRFLPESWGLGQQLPLFLVGTLLTVLISEMSYRFYEMPFLRWKTYFGGQAK
jgi:peptidoglycan/LPS O-acetylase OafA/YrhL